MQLAEALRSYGDLKYRLYIYIYIEEILSPLLLFSRKYRGENNGSPKSAIANFLSGTAIVVARVKTYRYVKSSSVRNKIISVRAERKGARAKGQRRFSFSTQLHGALMNFRYTRRYVKRGDKKNR